MDALKFFKSNVLPSILEPNALYLIKVENQDFLEIHLTDKTGTKIYSGITYDKINTLISQAAHTAVQEVLGATQGLVSKTYTFESTLQLTIPHNLGTKDYTFSIVNSEGQRVYAPDSAIDDNTFVVNFTEPESGTISVIFHI